MKKNMGLADKIIRLVIAAFIVFLYNNDTISGTSGMVLLVFAGIFVLTSFMNYCPLYLPFGINTTKNKK